MSEQTQSNSQSEGPEENPLETLAADLTTSLAGERVEVNQSSVKEVQGGQVVLQKSAARVVKAHALNMNDSAAVLVQSDSLEMRESSVVAVVGRSIEMTETNAPLIVGRQVQVQDARIFLLVANQVDGAVEATFSPRAALALGAGLGAMLLLGRQLIGLILPGSRKK
jgi:hypothetical protein